MELKHYTCAEIEEKRVTARLKLQDKHDLLACRSKLNWIIAKIIQDEKQNEKQNNESRWLEAGKVSMEMSKDDQVFAKIAGLYDNNFINTSQNCFIKFSYSTFGSNNI